MQLECEMVAKVFNTQKVKNKLDVEALAMNQDFQEEVHLKISKIKAAKHSQIVF